MVLDDSSFEVERSLLQLENIQLNPTPTPPADPNTLSSPTNQYQSSSFYSLSQKEGNLLLVIKELGSWLLKFRSSGFLYNRTDLLLPEFIKYDAQIIFQDFSSFQNAIIGSYEDEMNKGNVEISGQDQDLITLFREKCIKAGEASSRTSTLETPLRENRTILHSLGDEQPLKKGWLLKKRDIISGWKCRYFELFRGRLLYYRDANDVKPRGCILLAKAEIGKVQHLKIKRVSDHFGMIIEAKRPEKVIRIASERTGIDGKAEAEGWCQALVFASDVVDVITDDTATRRRKDSASTKLDLNTKTPINPFVRRRSNIGFVSALRTGDDSFVPMIVSASIILILAIMLHYVWIIKNWISTKLYVTIGILLIVLVLIFFQEFVFTSSEEERDHTNTATTKKSSTRGESKFTHSRMSSKKPSESAKTVISLASEEETEEGGQSTDQDSETSSDVGNNEYDS